MKSCTTSILARCKMGLTSHSHSQSVFVCVCVFARAHRSSTTEVRRERRRELGGQSTWRLGSRRPCLPPRRPERLHREGMTESRIIYTSHTEREKEREGERELVRDRPPAVRKRGTEVTDGEGKDKGDARRDPTSNAALRVHGNECSLYANGASRRSLSTRRRLSMRSARSLSSSLVSPAARFLLENFQENGMETFVRWKLTSLRLWISTLVNSFTTRRNNKIIRAWNYSYLGWKYIFIFSVRKKIILIDMTINFNCIM